ncbi:hypothetical protein O6H91_06G043300 [Diphasiastrum complanatum]|uniref:Uncharacterized protein n=1 Tax=Diphasiastrum complanatum TaxID=34168 RepID=A0ACC2DD12_DIPCM|nr:hypothetical protein O6H91_06G043300 [Diphasiastrum complanatum]
MVLAPTQFRFFTSHPLTSIIISYTNETCFCLRSFSQQVSISGMYKKLLDREWLLSDPDTKIHKVTFSRGFLSPHYHNLLNDVSFTLDTFVRKFMSSMPLDKKNEFYVVRDDLLHPIVGGNKVRKMDALFPFLEGSGVTDVVTCGGCQSAHTAALAVACAERKMVAHLLLRGERPIVPTGYNLISGMYGHVTYVPRAEYACRNSLLEKHAMRIAGSDGQILWLSNGTDEASIEVNCKSNEMAGSVHQMDGQKTTSDSTRHKESEKPELLQQYKCRKVAVVKEGAGDAIALLGLIRLVHFLSQNENFGCDQKVQLVVDSGTGTTAIGLALAVVLMGLPWEVVGIMLADTLQGYERQKRLLLEHFYRQFLSYDRPQVSNDGHFRLPLQWRLRNNTRKFGKVLDGDIETCQHVARETGILLDPIYTLASWEMAMQLCSEMKKGNGNGKVVMLHTGGTLGLFGLAQRFPSQFF